MESRTTRRGLLKATPLAAVTVALPCTALTVQKTDCSGWENAKAAYLAAGKRTAEASGPHNDGERDLYADAASAPVVSIDYIDPGFTIGAVTLQPRIATIELTKQGYERDHVLASVGDHPDYLAFRQSINAWKSRPERVALIERAETAEAEWMAACNAQADVWHTTASFPLAHPLLVAEKVELLRSEAAGDADWLTALVDGVAADLARINGRA